MFYLNKDLQLFRYTVDTDYGYMFCIDIEDNTITLATVSVNYETKKSVVEIYEDYKYPEKLKAKIDEAIADLEVNGSHFDNDCKKLF